MNWQRDIGVLGSGPAALAVAAACCKHGASVTLIAPNPRSSWKPNYCLWADEVPTDMQSVVEHVWNEVAVATQLGERQLRRPYVKLDNDAFQQHLWRALHESSARVVDGRATTVEHLPGETRVHIADAGVERVRVLIDASGAGSPFVRRVHAGEPAHQIAFGVLLDAPRHGFDLDRMTLMDFRSAAPDAVTPPSFLYLLPLSPDRLFVEETSLANRPGVDLSMLRSRLQARLASLGLERCRWIEEEHCSIAMGLGLPVHAQPLVPFGAAAAMVHPASGYSIAHVFRKAEPVAAAIVETLRTGDVEQAIAAGNLAVWSRPQRAAWELYAFGLETLVSMTALETARFFDAFFAMPVESWAGFLGGTLNPRDLGPVMTRLFRSLPASVRWHLVRTGMGAGAGSIKRTILQTGMS